MIVSMTPRTVSRTASSIGPNQSSKSMVPAATAAVFVVFFIMAWSPFRRSNAGISWGEHPGDYANRISTTSATAPGLLRFVDLDPSGLILSWGLRDWLGVYRHAVFITAPSMTTPAVTYFQSATSSFRASATIVVLRRRPPLRFTRSWNQRASAESG